MIKLLYCFLESVVDIGFARKGTLKKLVGSADVSGYERKMLMKGQKFFFLILVYIECQ